MSSSRGFLKDNKTSRTSSKFYGEAPLSNRNMTDGYYPDHQRTSYNSREFQAGIFTNELSKKADLRKKEEPRELPLELTEIIDYSNSTKVRSSKKQYDYPRQSKEESLHNYQQQIEFNEDLQIREELRQEMKIMKSQLEYNLMDKVKKMMNQQSARLRQSIGDLIAQTNNGFKKKEETLFILKTETFNLKEELSKLYKTYQTFSQESQDKFENIYVEMSNLGVRRSKSNGEYNMDLKNSFQGMNSSLSVNLGNEGHSSKLVNQVVFQLDSQKRELNETRALIDKLTLKLNSKMIEINSEKPTREEPKPQMTGFSKDEMSNMIREAFVDDKRKNKFDQKMEAFEIRMKQIEQIVFTQEQNIKGMNDQFANTVNNQLSPKIKKVQTAIVDIFTRIDPLELQKQINGKVASNIAEKLKDSKLLKIRNCSKPQSQKLSLLTGLNQDKITYKETYLLDQQNYLLDSEGNYLVEQTNNIKQRIKIDNDFIYVLQLKGIQISNAS